MSAMTADKELYRQLVKDSTTDAVRGRWESYTDIVLESWEYMKVGDGFGFPISADQITRMRAGQKGLYR